MNCSSNFSSSDCENRKVIKEGQSAIKRKTLDLDLSISLLPKGDIDQAGKNKIDSSLSLSLCPPSSSELNKMTEGDGSRKRARTTSSGLDLTL
ncbi:hypothetical protein Nepgr_017254 [Nepenthes gracilis]|uniref:Uncharacterized protein n=1 Tax=Nepenthes gracilis TaxID=150966 RepID=A0AAD3SQ33_NEPGR|nr:hypothetical protein Nepgr_017254 [Nepenthes gracilis]